MKDDYTHIAIILDRSGSMKQIKDDTIGGFNQFLEDQQKEEGYATVTLAQFDSSYELLEDFTDIGEVPLLTEETFIPRSMTALQDAIGLTVNSVGQKLAALDEKDRPSKVLICVMTDGDENASREFSPSDIKELVKLQTEEYKWEFVFIGANQDAVITSGTLGFDAGKTMTYAANSRGTTSAYQTLSDNVKTLRNSKGADTSEAMLFSDDQKKEQKDAGAVA
jgi:hypothetical protein|tara:strand:- start:756 stop:1421 length:666 start_codon:yes stop_codon:yes gene_type:complete